MASEPASVFHESHTLPIHIWSLILIIFLFVWVRVSQHRLASDSSRSWGWPWTTDPPAPFLTARITDVHLQAWEAFDNSLIGIGSALLSTFLSVLFIPAFRFFSCLFKYCCQESMVPSLESSPCELARAVNHSWAEKTGQNVEGPRLWGETQIFHEMWNEGWEGAKQKNLVLNNIIVCYM